MSITTHERGFAPATCAEARLCDRAETPLTATEVLGHRGSAAPQLSGGIDVPFVFPARSAFTGVLGVGKDYIAKKHGFEILGFADPIYTLARRYLGTDDKSVPGVRKFMQDVGQWGRGLVDHFNPLTPERHRITMEIQKDGVGVAGEGLLDAPDFGSNPDFWVSILLHRVKERGWSRSRGTLVTRVAVTNCRFPNELAALQGAGFKVFHVTCSPETLHERRAAAGYTDPTVFNNVSERLALEYDLLFRADVPLPPGVDVVWNDHRPAPEVRNNQVYINP